MESLWIHAKKVFRGNLDFKKGARHSKGVEEEYVILFDPTVKSDQSLHYYVMKMMYKENMLQVQDKLMKINYFIL